MVGRHSGQTLSQEPKKDSFEGALLIASGAAWDGGWREAMNQALSSLCCQWGMEPRLRSRRSKYQLCSEEVRNAGTNCSFRNVKIRGPSFYLTQVAVPGYSAIITIIILRLRRWLC